MPGAPRADEESIACVLITARAIAAGRMLPPDIPPGELTPAQLTGFRADDLMAGPDGPRSGSAAS